MIYLLTYVSYHTFIQNVIMFQKRFLSIGFGHLWITIAKAATIYGYFMTCFLYVLLHAFPY